MLLWKSEFKTYSGLLVLLTVFAVLAVFSTKLNSVKANSIVNQVSVESRADNGGQASSFVSVQSTVNGQVVESYKETSTNGNIEYNQKIVVEGDGQVYANHTPNSYEVDSLSYTNKNTADIEELRSVIALLEVLLDRLTQLLIKQS